MFVFFGKLSFVIGITIIIIIIFASNENNNNRIASYHLPVNYKLHKNTLLHNYNPLVIIIVSEYYHRRVCVYLQIIQILTNNYSEQSKQIRHVMFD
jgi:hypothetical protein